MGEGRGGDGPGREDRHPLTPEPLPVAWYGNWKLWFGAAGVVILLLLVYAAL